MIFSTYMSALFEKVTVNVIKMPMCWGKHYIVVAHENLSEWVEMQTLTHTTSSAVACFLW